MPQYFGDAIVTSTDATALLGNLTGAISDNIAAVLVVVGGVAGIHFARKMLNRGLRGKV